MVELRNLSHHDELEDVSAERDGEDLGEKETQTNHPTHSSEGLQPLWSGCGLHGGVKPRLPRLEEESRLHLGGGHSASLFDD